MDPLKTTPPPETKLHFLDYWRIIRIRKTVILAVFLLVVLTATLVTWILPVSYSSEARIKVDRDVSDIPGMTQTPLLPGYDPYFIQTEFEVIQSERILSNVVHQLNLSVEWGKKYAGGERLKTQETMTLLRNRMDLNPVRNTSLITIRVFSQDAEEAARIANEIAETYKEYRLAQRRELTMGGIRILEDRFQDQEKKVQAAQREVDELRAKLEISDADAAGTSPTTLLEAEVLRRLKAQQIEGEAAYVREATLLQELKTTAPEDLKSVLPTAVADPQLAELLQQLNLVEQERIRLARDLTDDHPAVVTVTRQIKDIETKIAQRADGIIRGLEKRVASMKAYLDSLTRNVEEAMRVDIEKAEKSRPYFEAKQRLEEVMRFRSILNLKLAQERIDVDLPRTAMVEIVDTAKPGLRPVRPNKPLNIALGVIIGLVVGVGLAFFIEYLDTSVKTIDDVERALQSPVLGVIPQNVGSLLQEGAESPHAEAYRVLRTNLLFSRKDDKLNSIAVVSAGAGEGKTTTVFNLATVFAQGNQRVIIVDSDLRRPTLHKRFGVSNSIGLTNYLLKQNKLEEVIQTSPLATLDFLPSGKLPSSSLGILNSAQMKDLIAQLKQRYDFVFFDSPPIMGVSDASILASEMDMTVQVIQYRRYPQPMNIRAKQLIEKVGGNLIGIVLNNINMSQDESYYYYSGYYHDYYYRSSESSDKDEAAGEKKADDSQAKVEIKKKY
ncbi:MAG TPA: polysaccharide biosynthesis tyrosine autokinase [Verrucomicrobiota bacterium]|jgi:capsular exopolysaccharide synthesis family protein|nr:MAG: Tyrosine-protein kinase YwqD [Verrucomicrobia bacterium ADurb.Bin118]HPY31514.1 polysaccharide biosynthesis tyrosine autokinase [Verrucomicrobiota bacterium]HQB17846.1 polysaccharide biosynthesis tyrosine autokinase [Verrucomicrobiota bacterium]